MKFFLRILTLFTLCGTVQAQDQPIAVTVTGTPADHIVRWNTNPGRCYGLEVTLDLQTWTEVDDHVAGTGDMLECHCTSATPPARLYYRVKQYHLGFLALPLPNAEIFKEDGVCFAFNLDSAPATLTKLCISKRPDANSPWELIGTLTDIVTLKGVKTVRGPAIWLPTATGPCEVKVEGKNAAGNLLCTETRQFTIVVNTPPTITVTGFSVTSPNDNAAYGRMNFTTVASDVDAGDKVTRVEYFADGMLVGTDYAAPFGNFTADLDEAYGVVNLRGQHQFTPNTLGAGSHGITAKAYDTRGGVGETTTAFDTTGSGTGSNNRPTLNSFSLDGQYLIKLPTDAESTVTANYLADDPDGRNNLANIQVTSDLAATGNLAFYPPFPIAADSMTLDTAGWEPGLHNLLIFSRDNSGALSFPRTLQILVNSNQYVAASTMASQITSASAPVVHSSLKFWGAYAASQPYTGGVAAGLDAQMNTGVLFTTGKFAFWDDDDFAEDRTHEWADTPGDALIHDRLSGAYTRDAAALEFDVDCINSQLEMEIQFGSEEYPELVGDPNGLAFDALGITVDGTLISLVPDGGAPISTKSIHPAIPGSITEWPNDQTQTHPKIREHLFIDGETEIEPFHQPAVEYDGMTARLRLHAFVTPGIHKIRISIADTEYPGVVPVSRRSHDSAVFIRSGSLRTITPTP